MVSLVWPSLVSVMMKLSTGSIVIFVYRRVQPGNVLWRSCHVFSEVLLRRRPLNLLLLWQLSCSPGCYFKGRPIGLKQNSSHPTLNVVSLSGLLVILKVWCLRVEPSSHPLIARGTEAINLIFQQLKWVVPLITSCILVKFIKPFGCYLIKQKGISFHLMIALTRPQPLRPSITSSENIRNPAPLIRPSYYLQIPLIITCHTPSYSTRLMGKWFDTLPFKPMALLVLQV